MPEREFYELFADNNSEVEGKEKAQSPIECVRSYLIGIDWLKGLLKN